MKFESFERRIKDNDKLVKLDSLFNLAKNGIITGNVINIGLTALKEVDFKGIFFDNDFGMLYVILSAIFWIAFFSVVVYYMIHFVLDILVYVEISERKAVVNNALAIEEDNSGNQFKYNTVSTRVKAIDLLNLFLTCAFMIPVAAFGLFFIVSGFVIMIQDTQNNGIVGGIIFIILGLIPVFAGVRPFINNLNEYKAQYFGKFVVSANKIQKDFKKKLPGLIFAAVIILASIILALVKIPLLPGRTGALIQMVISMLVMTLGIFLLVLTIKK